MEARVMWIALYLLVIENWFCNSVNIDINKKLFSTSLYDPTSDDVSVLNNGTLKRTVYGSKQAWFVQFYSSWCGHCVHFAPTWKEFAVDIKGWQSIAKVAALNCADEHNSKICSQYIDVGFPTLRLFSALQKNGTGDIYKGPRDLTHLRHGLIDRISKHSSQNTPSHWPTLTPVSLQWLLTFYSRNSKPKMKVVAVVFEDTDSYTGRELILDMSSEKDLLVLRVLKEELIRNPLPPKWNVGELPSLFILKQNGEPSVLWRSGNRDLFVKALQKYIQKTLPASNIEEGSLLKTTQTLNEQKVITANRSHIDDNKTAQQLKQVQQPGLKQVQTIVNYTIGKIASRSVVYMEDLESTLIYSLKYEVGLQKEIGAEATRALQAYVAVLNKYFPGRPDVMNTLKHLQQSLQPYTHLTSEEWSNVIDRLHSLQDPGCFLENEVTWVGCQGSTPVHRGYPCGLWVLFHTLTVSHARSDAHYRKSDSKEVLRAMKDYIQFFFGCRVCSENFSKESAHLETGVRNLDDSVLWLWKVHNSVNKRLAGDLSEDPEHPKIAFPSYRDCPTCQDLINNPRRWNKTRVLAFMRELYGVNNIDFAVSGVEPKRNERVTAEMLKHLNAGARVTYGYIKLGIDTTDVSMCVLLYVLCSVLLVVICVYVKRRRKRKLYQRKYLV